MLWESEQMIRTHKIVELYCWHSGIENVQLYVCIDVYMVEKSSGCVDTKWASLTHENHVV